MENELKNSLGADWLMLLKEKSRRRMHWTDKSCVTYQTETGFSHYN
ncbi:MAG: hypothetical protein ABIJ08_06195 [Nanoarchaeota archaeon]